MSKQDYIIVQGVVGNNQAFAIEQHRASGMTLSRYDRLKEPEGDGDLLFSTLVEAKAYVDKLAGFIPHTVFKFDEKTDQWVPSKQQRRR